MQAFREGIAHFERLFAVTPEVVVHDLHPDYLSTTYALERAGVELVGVQHHHAHLAAVLAEHGAVDGPAVGAIFDGTGYGTDGTVWGGELLVGDLTGFERAGSLRPVRMPGAAAAIRQPWRMAFAWLAEAFGEPRPPTPQLRVDPERWDAIGQVYASASVSPLTSSIGRLFDAVGALCGIRSEVIRGPGRGRTRGGGVAGRLVWRVRDVGLRPARSRTGDRGRPGAWRLAGHRRGSLSRRSRRRDRRRRDPRRERAWAFESCLEWRRIPESSAA